MRLFSILALASLVGCGEPGPMTVTSTACVSAQQWSGGNEGSPFMHPGVDCVGCHAKESEAPAFSIAGTVYASTAPHDADDCTGVDGTEVVITDKTGKVFKLQTNATGNFFLDKSIAVPVPPIHVKVVRNGEERFMLDAPSTGACNTCHGKAGANDAPGRILAP